MIGTEGGSGMGAGRRRNFVGRARELEELVEALDEAVAGRGSLALVTGEPGIGKTRLLSEVAVTAAARGADVHWGRCWHGDTPSYQPWLDVLRTLVDDLDDGDPGGRLGPGAAHVAHLIGATSGRRPEESELARFHLFDAVGKLLEVNAARRPLVLLFDDLQWSDVASILLLEFVSRGIADAPILACAAYRDVDLLLRPDASDAFAALARHGFALPLGGLSEPEVAHFVSENYETELPSDIGPRLHALTDGNPFFIDELVRLLVAEAREVGPAKQLPIPKRVRDVVKRRMAPMTDEAAEVLRVAAVVGARFRIRTVAEASGRSVDAVRSALWEASRLELVREAEAGTGGYAFVHELVRETIQSDLTPGERIRVHRDVGEALEGAQGTPDARSIDQIAHHFYEAAEAADRSKSLRYVRLSGEGAMSRFAFEDAVSWFERALEIDDVDEGKPARAFDLLCALGEANRRAARFGPSMDAYAKATELAADLSEPAAGLTEAALGFEDVRMASLNIWQLPTSMLQLRTAIDAVGADDPVRRIKLCARLAQVLLFLSPAEAPAVAREALELAEAEGDESLRATALEGLRWSIWHPGALEERLAVSTDWLATAQRVHDAEAVLRARILLAVDFLESGDLAAVTAQVAAFEREAGSVHQAWFTWWPAAFGATEALMDGSFHAAERHLDQLRAAASQFDSLAPLVAGLADCIVAWERGEPPAVEAAVARVLPLVPLPGFREAALAFERTAHGDIDGAREHVSTFLAILPNIPDAFMRPSMVAVITPCVAFVGDRSVAQQLYEELAPLGGRPVLVAPFPCFFTTSHWLGVLAMAAGRPDDAARHFDEALEISERMGAPAWIARTRFEYGRMLLGSDRPRGEAMLGEAARAADAMGMIAVATQARDALGNGGLVAVDADDRIFRREGDVWRLTFGTSTALVGTTKGLAYVRELLSRPGEEVHALQLQSVVDGGAPGAARTVDRGNAMVADSGRGAEAIDAAAMTAYRRRITELQEEIDEATSFADDERAARCRAELDSLTDELSRSLGLGGRPRTPGSPAERARVNVTRSIARAIDRVSEAHPELGEHLARSIRTGSFCLYAGDPKGPIRWST